MEVKTWGEGWHEDMSRSRDNRCPECGNGALGIPSVENIQKYIVGLDDGREAYKVRGIFKCPRCENLFWFHLDRVIARWALEDMGEK